MMSFKNKTVVITGGAKGIGAGCASVFYREGANVAIIDVDEKAGSEFVEKLGDRSLFVKCDISSEREVQNTVKKIADHFGSIDYLVNNAGILKYFSVTETSEEDWDTVINVNLKGAFLCAKHCIPHMKQNEDGVVVNMSSVQAFVAQQNVAAYIATKSALIGLTRSIAVDYAPNVRSVAICPGGVDTPMNRNAFQESPDPELVRKETENLHLNGRMATQEEIGELVAFVCSEKGKFINGQPIRIDGGLGIRVGGSKME
jgi:NAD(P)-dependent dehydrogenase (short-subunit alcohol dehydrogenase family)